MRKIEIKLRENHVKNIHYNLYKRKFTNYFLFFLLIKAYGTWSSRVIPHPSTNQAYERLRSEFGMGSPACATSMAVYTK